MTMNDATSRNEGAQTQEADASTYHAVCPDCTAEGLHDTEHTARVLVDGHNRRHDHGAKFEEVDGE